MTEKPIAILTIHVERRGQNIITNGLISIGWVFGTLDGQVLEKRRLDLQPLNSQTFEKRCFEEFWSKSENAAKLEIMQQGAIDPHIAISRFRQTIDKYEIDYDLRIISHSKDHDVAFINFYLALGNLPTLNYKADGKTFRPTYDMCSCYMCGALGLGYSAKKEWASDLLVASMKGIDMSDLQDYASHAGCMPENRAEHIYKFHLEAVQSQGSDFNNL